MGLVSIGVGGRIFSDGVGLAVFSLANMMILTDVSCRLSWYTKLMSRKTTEGKKRVIRSWSSVRSYFVQLHLLSNRDTIHGWFNFLKVSVWKKLRGHEDGVKKEEKEYTINTQKRWGDDEEWYVKMRDENRLGRAQVLQHALWNVLCHRYNIQVGISSSDSFVAGDTKGKRVATELSKGRETRERGKRKNGSMRTVLRERWNHSLHRLQRKVRLSLLATLVATGNSFSLI